MNIRTNTTKRMVALLAALCLMLAMSVTAYAHEVPDLTRTGSLSISMTYYGKPVPDGTLALYRVGAISEENGNYSFVLTEDFVDSRLSLEDISSDTLAEKMMAYASGERLTGSNVKIGADGKAAVSDLTLGLYLVVQTEAANGYEAVSPFLVSIPMNEDGTYVYDVDASPKTSLTPEKPTPPTPPDPIDPVDPVDPTEPPTTPEPSTPSIPHDTPHSMPEDQYLSLVTNKHPVPMGTDPFLPQTGQLNWPVPVLTVLGLCLFLLGFFLRYEKKGASHAK